MVIGNGLIAQALSNLSGWENDILFASGVSDSSSTNEEMYLREKELVKKYLGALEPDASFIYFSSTGILDPLRSGTAYAEHKKGIETLITGSTQNYLIIRLPNVVGRGGNQKTLINFFAGKINAGELIAVQQNVIRHLIDVEDLPAIMNEVKNKFGKRAVIVNIETSFPVTPTQIIAALETVLHKKAVSTDYSPIQARDLQKMKTGNSDTLIWNISPEYLYNLIAKYFSS